MPETVAQKIRDDIIAQDVRYNRVNASVRADVNARLDQLEKEIVTAMIRVDANGARRKTARQRRLKKLNDEIGIIIRTAYSEINGILRNAGRRVAKVEARKVNQIVAEQLP
jgi:flavin-dependent dehydrogenase